MDKVKIKSPEDVRKYLEGDNLPATERVFIEDLLNFAEEVKGSAYAEHVAVHIWKLCAVEPYEVFHNNLSAATQILASGPREARIIEAEILKLHRIQRLLLRDELKKTWVDEVFPIF